VKGRKKPHAHSVLPCICVEGVVLPLSGSEPIPNLNRTRTEPQFRFRHLQRTGPNPRCGSGFEDCLIFPDLSEHVRTCANLKFPLLPITIFATKNSRMRTFLASTEVSNIKTAYAEELWNSEAFNEGLSKLEAVVRSRDHFFPRSV
jgi:hypothetical protein